MEPESPVKPRWAAVTATAADDAEVNSASEIGRTRDKADWLPADGAAAVATADDEEGSRVGANLRAREPKEPRGDAAAAARPDDTAAGATAVEATLVPAAMEDC